MIKARQSVERHLAPPPADATSVERQLVADELALHATALREQAAREMAERGAAGDYSEGVGARDALMLAAERLDQRASAWREPPGAEMEA